MGAEKREKEARYEEIVKALIAGGGKRLEEIKALSHLDSNYHDYWQWGS